MTEAHTLQVLDEAPLEGKAANVEAWKGYASSFPEYLIYPHRLAELDGRVAVLGHTTGSHLALPDAEERMLTVIWLADVVDQVCWISGESSRTPRSIGGSSDSMTRSLWCELIEVRFDGVQARIHHLPDRGGELIG